MQLKIHFDSLKSPLRDPICHNTHTDVILFEIDKPKLLNVYNRLFIVNYDKTHSIRPMNVIVSRVTNRPYKHRASVARTIQWRQLTNALRATAVTALQTNRMINPNGSTNHGPAIRPRKRTARSDWLSNCHCLMDVIMQNETEAVRNSK